MKLYHPTKSINRDEFAKVQFAVKDYPAVTLNSIDLDMYVETAANGGDNNNDGLTPSTPKLDIVSALTDMPQINLGTTRIHIGPGSHLGFYLGRLLNETDVAINPYCHVQIIGTVEQATISVGAVEGVASGGGVEGVFNLPYFDKPSGAVDWVIDELKGKAINKLGGKGPSWAYVQSNTTTRVYLALPFPFNSQIPDSTFEFEVVDNVSQLNQAHPKVFNDINNHTLFMLNKFFGDVVVENIKFESDYGPTAQGINAHNTTANVIVNKCIFDSLATNYFLIGIAAANCNGRWQLRDVLFNGVGRGVPAVSNCIRGRKAGPLENYNLAFLNNRSGVYSYNIGGMPILLINGTYVEGGAGLFKQDFHTSMIDGFRVGVEGASGDIITSATDPLHINLFRAKFDGGQNGIRAETDNFIFPRNAGNVINLTDTTIQNMVDDGIVLSGGKISTSANSGSALSGLGNGGYGVRLKNNSTLDVVGGGDIDITGTLGDVLVGESNVNHTDVSVSGDYVVDAGSLCRYGRG